MRNGFLLALIGIVVLGAGAALAVFVVSRPSERAVVTVGHPAAVEVLPDPSPLPVAPPPAPVAATAPAPAPAPAPPVAAAEAPVSEPIRAAPAPAPGLSERLESADAEERHAAMLELQERRKANGLKRLNRHRRQQQQ